MTSADDDDLLDALAGLARDARAAHDPRLDALTAGALSAEDEAALRAEAADDPALAAAVALHTPLGAESRARFAAAAQAAFASAGGDDEPVFAELDDFESVEVPARPAEAAPDNVIRLPRRRWVAPVVVLAAAAVALVVWRPSHPPLPPYDAEVSGGAAEVRGAEVAETPRLGPDERFELRLRPHAPVEGPLALRAGVIVDGAVRPWPVEATFSAEGVAQITGTASALGLTAFGVGDRVVRVVVGRPDALPAVQAEMGAAGEGWWRFDVAVVLVE